MCNIILITHVLMSSLFFFFNDTATTEIYTLSLHDALPISHPAGKIYPRTCVRRPGVVRMPSPLSAAQLTTIAQELAEGRPRSEEHTSELQSRLHLVCRLLLEKKKHRVSSLIHDCNSHRDSL